MAKPPWQHPYLAPSDVVGGAQQVIQDPCESETLSETPRPWWALPASPAFPCLPKNLGNTQRENQQGGDSWVCVF